MSSTGSGKSRPTSGEVCRAVEEAVITLIGSGVHGCLWSFQGRVEWRWKSELGYGWLSRHSRSKMLAESHHREGQRKDGFKPAHRGSAGPCCPTRRVSSPAYGDIRAQIAAIIRKRQHALSYWEGKLRCVSWWWFQCFTAKGSRSFNRARNHGKMCWEELKFGSGGGKKKRGGWGVGGSRRRVKKLWRLQWEPSVDLFEQGVHAGVEKCHGYDYTIVTHISCHFF